MIQLTSETYRDLHAALGRRLDRVASRAGLAAALDALKEHQIGTGFIRDRLDEVERFVFPREDGSGQYFSAQFNPARARRFAGAGLSHPPPDRRRINNGCFLCGENIEWQQAGRQFGYDLPFCERRYTAWMNPFPLVPGHTVVATRKHVPQCWGGKSADLRAIVHDLLEMAAHLPGWIGFYNGEGAGASITGHLHYHFLPRPAGYGQMPLELALRNRDQDGLIEMHYPLTFGHWHGNVEQVQEELGPWLDNWLATAGASSDATANAIAIADPDSDRLDFYFIPRHKARSRAEGLNGVVGGFEALGEIVCATDEEKQLLDSGRINFDHIKKVLGQVSVAL